MKHVSVVVLLMLPLICGCETLKGSARGFGKDIQNTEKGADSLSKAATDPDKNGWHALKKADGWMQENLW